MKNADARRLREQLMSLVRCLRQQAQTEAMPWARLLLMGAIDRLGKDATPSLLAASEGMRSSNLAKALRDLEEDDLIVRIPDAEDRRKVRVQLTEVGRRLLSESRARREHWLVDVMQTRLTAKERERLIEAGHLMERIATFPETRNK